MKILISSLTFLLILSRFTFFEISHKHNKGIENTCAFCVSNVRNGIDKPEHVQSDLSSLYSLEEKYTIEEIKEIPREIEVKSKNIPRAPPSFI